MPATLQADKYSKFKRGAINRHHAITASQGTQIACDPPSKRHRVPATLIRGRSPIRDTGCLRLYLGRGVRAAALGRAMKLVRNCHVSNGIVRRTHRRTARDTGCL